MHGIQAPAHGFPNIHEDGRVCRVAGLPPGGDTLQPLGRPPGPQRTRRLDPVTPAKSGEPETSPSWMAPVHRWTGCSGSPKRVKKPSIVIGARAGRSTRMRTTSGRTRRAARGSHRMRGYPPGGRNSVITSPPTLRGSGVCTFLTTSCNRHNRSSVPREFPPRGAGPPPSTLPVRRRRRQG